MVSLILSYLIFCQQEQVNPPFAIKLQDHGFGGNWDRFGASGFMQTTARHYGIYPSYLLVGDNTEPWEGYSLVPGTGVSIGGRHANHCRLYYRSDDRTS